MRNVSLTLILVLGLSVVEAAPVWAQTNEWTRRGPLPEGGTIGRLIVDPRDPSTLYATNWGDETQAGQGIFKSTNGGVSWRAVRLGLPFLVSLLTIDPQDHRTLYAGTVENGAFKSTDAGESWGPTGLTDISIRALAVDPQDRNTLYVSAEVIDHPRRHLEIYKSTDAGTSWVSLGGIAYDAWEIVALAVDPKNSSTVYAGNGHYSFGGLYKSIDGGITWIEPPALRGCYINAILFSPRDASILYALGQCWQGEEELAQLAGKVFKTTDAGATWSEVNFGLADWPASWAVAFDPDHPQVMYGWGLYSASLYKSVDGGASWSKFNNGLPNRGGYGLAFGHGTPYATYAITSDGIFTTSSLLATFATLDPASVRLGSTFTATLSGTNLTDATYFDVRFRSPRNNTEQEVPNWQQGLSATHRVPADSAPGTWTITGLRAHQDIDDHNGDFVLVSATLNLNPVVVTAVRLDPSTALPGSSFSATFSGTNLTSETYFDVRFRSPGDDTDQLALNWQKGTSAAHSVPIDTAAGTWSVTGIWAHENADDHSSDFVPVSTVLEMTKR